MVGRISEKLTSATGGLRGELVDRRGFFRALREGRLHLEQYVRFLRALTALSTVIDRQSGGDSGGAEDLSVERAEFFPWHGRARLKLLQEDLFFFRYHLVRDLPDGVEMILKFVADMRIRLKDEALAGYGCSFALETLREDFAGSFRSCGEKWNIRDAGGFSFFSGLSDAREKEGGSERGEAGPFSEEQLSSVVKAALETFGFLRDLAELLYSSDPANEYYSSFTLNPASGAYPACQERNELLAVLHASDRMLAEYPYYLYRYGTSGFFFSDSDGAWLATLPALGFAGMKDQVNWLAGLLAFRGMPTFLLARHMLILREELERARPNRTEQWELFLQISDWLDPRDTEGAFRGMGEQIRALRASCGFPEGYRAAEAVRIIVGAFIDEKRGFPGGVRSVLSWYGDPEGFPEEWIRSVEKLTGAAGELMDSVFS